MKNDTPNYTPTQEAVIAGFVGTGTDGALTLADATAIASDPAMNHPDKGTRTAKSIVAKISRMGLTYERKVATRKDGTAVQTKADLVAQIATAAGVTFEGLALAPRGDLVALRDFVSRKAA